MRVVRLRVMGAEVAGSFSAVMARRACPREGGGLGNPMQRIPRGGARTSRVMTVGRAVTAGRAVTVGRAVTPGRAIPHA
jgi:hypothetical protein